MNEKIRILADLSGLLRTEQGVIADLRQVRVSIKRHLDLIAALHEKSCNEKPELDHYSQDAC